MAILLDPARWPAHGTVFGHLVSDVSLDELHAFAARAGLPPQAFDHDHYDVPERRYPALRALGAEEVSSSELMRRLLAGGLRVRPAERTPKAATVLPGLRAAWQRLLPQAEELGERLLDLWSEPHRRYHDVRHLAHCLESLDALGAPQAPGSMVHLAAWFHDAVHAGRPGEDERRSAQLAEAELRGLLPAAEVAEVARLVLLTIDHSTAPGDLPGELLIDADLSVLGLPRARYHIYVRDVRQEYSQFDDETFRRGRLAVLDALLAKQPLFLTTTGRRLWESAARRNLIEEHRRWLQSAGERE